MASQGHFNVFDLQSPVAGERFHTLVRCRNVEIERIASSSSPGDTLYKQTEDEWVMLLRGTATLELDGEPRRLVPGDCLFILAHTPHRVLETSSDALWLAVHIHPFAPQG